MASNSDCFAKVKQMAIALGIPIVSEDPNEEILVVTDHGRMLNGLVLDCEDPVLVVQQMIMPVPAWNREDLFERLLQMNGTLVHGAFMVDEEVENIYFRDTLELANLDLNELEATISALTLALAEYGNELLSVQMEQIIL